MTKTIKDKVTDLMEQLIEASSKEETADIVWRQATQIAIDHWGCEKVATQLLGAGSCLIGDVMAEHKVPITTEGMEGILKSDLVSFIKTGADPADVKSTLERVLEDIKRGYGET
jgi:hypothetical protein